MRKQDYPSPVQVHYGSENLSTVIMKALRDSGKNLTTITVDDLAPVDQFHIGGKSGTLKMAELAGIRGNEHVLDIGGGLGGAARILARNHDCRVTVLDLTEEYCQTGSVLTGLTGLDHLVTFRQGDALELPFAANEFDTVWLQHSTMNIPDKKRLFAEIYRVVRPGGKVAIHEIMAGTSVPLHFPVPWAKEASINYLLPPKQVRAILKETGFEELSWQDVTAPSTEWFKNRVALTEKSPSGPRPVGIWLLLGADSQKMLANQLRNLSENRVSIIEAVFRKP